MQNQPDVSAAAAAGCGCGLTMFVSLLCSSDPAWDSIRSLRRKANRCRLNTQRASCHPTSNTSFLSPPPLVGSTSCQSVAHTCRIHSAPSLRAVPAEFRRSSAWKYVLSVKPSLHWIWTSPKLVHKLLRLSAFHLKLVIYLVLKLSRMLFFKLTRQLLNYVATRGLAWPRQNLVAWTTMRVLSWAQGLLQSL